MWPLTQRPGNSDQFGTRSCERPQRRKPQKRKAVLPVTGAPPPPPRPALTPASNRRVFNLRARSQRRVYKRCSQTGFTKVTCIPAKISLKRKIPFLKGGGGARETNYVRHNTFKICIEITNQAFPCDSKVQNTTLKGIQTALLYITVLVAQDGRTCQQREPNFCFYHRCQTHTVYVCMTHSCIFYTRVKIHPW